MRPRLLGLCLLACAVAPAQAAMFINPRGTGQVLLYPYYTVNAGQQTIFSLANTTPRAKIVQVNFREAYNGRLVLRFDVILGANDTWTGTVFESPADGITHLGRRDDSCTSPTLDAWTNPGTANGGPSQSFLPFDYTGNNEDGGPRAATRMREGYFEFVERAELVDDLAVAANTRNCNRFADLKPIATHASLRPPAGGLRGSFAVVDVAEGTILAGNATAIEGFSTTPHFVPNENPILFDAFAAPAVAADGIRARVPVDGKLVEFTYPANRKVDALSALLMTDALLGDVTHEAGLGSNSEWVISAPTKRFHADGDRALTQLAPFANLFGASGPDRACTAFAATLHDRRGRSVALLPGPFLDPPPPFEPPQFMLCHAVDVVAYDAPPSLEATPVLGSAFGARAGEASPATDAGSLELTLGVIGDQRTFLPAGTDGPALRGLPVIGFEAVKYVNGNLTPGVLANYTLGRALTSRAACSSGGSAPCP
ncbi:MAG TPA: hypothetical protein VLF18_21980 [Tahibacter sp.]|uniref:hypothetical protein n=1 Tax=Tahibacter sp. TaxID=2056211 RepID=UPI002C51585F|nr:hypothetical protein [Tahibacter sp.]HSX62862.1 hypothetical protein [Tahibacter sp.]